MSKKQTQPSYFKLYSFRYLCIFMQTNYLIVSQHNASVCFSCKKKNFFFLIHETIEKTTCNADRSIDTSVRTNSLISVYVMPHVSV